VIVGDVRDPYFAEIVHSIQQVVDEQGRLLYICSSHRDPTKEIEYVKLLRSQSVSAMIMAGSGITDSKYVDELEVQINAFREGGGIVASIGRHMIRSRAVLPDNFGGATMLGRALVELGHRRFGVIKGPASLTSTAERFAGLMKALRAAGIAASDVAVVESDYGWEGGTEAAARLLGEHSDLTCIIAQNDLMALGAQRYLQRNGLDVPGDISVAGFDDVVSAVEAQPALSTVRIHLPEMSRRVAEIALAGKKDLPEEMEDVFAASLAMRESTAKPRRAKTIRLKRNGARR
jgi:LacI family transcriptional regulator